MALNSVEWNGRGQQDEENADLCKCRQGHCRDYIIGAAKRDLHTAFNDRMRRRL